MFDDAFEHRPPSLFICQLVLIEVRNVKVIMTVTGEPRRLADCRGCNLYLVRTWEG